MEPTWLEAPWPALRVRSGADAGVRLNDAAARWARQLGLEPAQLAAWAAGFDAARAASPQPWYLGTLPLRARCVALPDGHLLWLEPAAAAVAEAELRADAARHAFEFLDRALVLAGVSVWRIDLARQRIHFNAVGFHVAGMPQDASGVALDAMRATVHPDDLPAVVQGAEEAIASDRVVDVVARYRNADGSWRTLLTRRVAERDAEGRAVALAGISVDMSGQQAERDRAEAMAERARLAAEALGVGFWSRDDSSDRAHWDDRMYRIDGRDPALGPPSLQEWLRDCVHPQDRARMAQQALQASGEGPAVGTLVEATFRVHDQGGAQRWVQSWTRRVLRGGRRVSFGMHVDVSARHEAEQLAQHERLRTQMAIEAAGVGIWERDAEGRVVYWNEAMYRLRGIEPAGAPSPDDVMDSTLDAAERERFAALRRQHLAQGLPYRHEFRVRCPDGTWRWLATEGRALRDADGAVLGMAGVNYDVTERRHAELLAQEKLRLEQASRDKAAFFARVSHELRTPMNAVLGFTRLMQDDPQDMPSLRQQERLGHVEQAAQAMMVLIDDLLQIARTATASPPSAPGAGLDVLCIEDNAVNLQLVRELVALRPAMRLRTAETGRAGIDAALAAPPQLVLLDLHLPDLAGLEVMRSLRQHGALAGCRIVALSADAMPDSVRAALAAGFDDYWTKPIQFDQFLAGIDQIAADVAAGLSRPLPLRAPAAP